MSRAITPQAVDCADSLASRSEGADAEAQLRWPRKATHTSHSARCAASVRQVKSARIASTTATPTSARRRGAAT